MVTAAYVIMLLTCAFFFIGACFYIGGMVEDLKLTLAELKADSDTITDRLLAEILFHNQLLEYAILLEQTQITFLNLSIQHFTTSFLFGS